MINILDEHFESIEEFKIKAEQYENGEIDPVRFKAFRVAMGIYEQRVKETYMTRTRIPGGVITLEQFEVINEIAKKYSHGKIHLTSRQDIQFHNVELDDVYTIMKELIKVGIITKGTGGNTVRNVECSPLSGVSADEVFDVTPYVKEVTNYLIKDPSTMNLPRKYKIAFSNSPQDTGNATISDLGFIAKISEGKRGFEVYGGGGLGGSPRAALKLSDFIEDKEALYYIQAMKEIFEREGDRNNKHKARIRYIVYRLGEEKFIQLFNEQLEKVKREKNLDLNIDVIEEEVKQGVKSNFNINKEYEIVLFQQKQPGYYSVYIHPQSGNLNSGELDKVLDFIKSLNYEVTIRLTNTQGFFVRDLKEEDAVKLLDIIADFASTISIDHSITCAGSSTCQLGLCLSQNLLQGIKEEFKEASVEVKRALPKLFISGCPNSCGQHQKGKIGLSGKAQRSEDGLVPAYSISFGGGVGADTAKIGEVYGDIIAKKIPKYLLELSNLKSNSEYEDFDEFLKNKSEEIKELIYKYSEVETFKENADLYYDFGTCEKFSLKGRGAGECSTGALDVMKLDLSNAENSLEKFNITKNSDDLYAAAVSASRVLLILKAIDTNKDREIFKEFIKNFVDTGYLKASVTELIDILIDYKLGDIKDISDKLSDIEYVVNKVKAMHDSLNGHLEITLQKETEEDNNSISESEEASQSKDYEVIDFRGVKCPINFVKVKIELSKIKSGDKRGFYLDDGDPISNVPKSVETEGHKIVSIDSDYEGYNLLVVEKK